MEERTTRRLGGLGIAGGLLAVVASVPSGWYGVPETDAYVFDPPALSALWIERTVMPLVGVLAGALLVAGVAGLVLRDRPVAGRLRRWSGYAAVAALALVDVAAALFGVSAPGGGTGDLSGALMVILAALVGLAGVVVLVPALVALGVGYARTDRPRVGYALAGGTVLALVLWWVTWSNSTGLGVLTYLAPLALVFVAVGAELWTHPEPVPESSAGSAGGQSAPDIEAGAAGDGPPPVEEGAPDPEDPRGEDETTERT